MKRILLLCSLVVIIFSSYGQKKSSKAFAITSEKQGGAVWTEVKLIDLQTGQVLKNVFENNKAAFNIYNARTGDQIKVKDEKGKVTDHQKLPFSGFSAACAYDRKHNRLYYTPMFVNQLRYIDLASKTTKIFYFEAESFSTAGYLNNEANHITRMVIGADGNGYALNNDATHLVRFSTGKKPVITDLGSVNDDPENGNISIRNRATSWGGDMIADAIGNLYLISANRSVFKINIGRKTARFVATIEGLPANFTTNGAVVDEDGTLVVSSANSVAGYYRVDMNNWSASPIPPAVGKVFNTSDLANGNLAFANERQQQIVPAAMRREIVANNRIAIFPNPVTEGLFRVSFDNYEHGRYEIQLVDIRGRILTQKSIAVGARGQVEEMNVTPQLSKGMYLVKVLNNKKKTVFADKIFVE